VMYDPRIRAAFLGGEPEATDRPQDTITQ